VRVLLFWAGGRDGGQYLEQYEQWAGQEVVAYALRYAFVDVAVMALNPHMLRKADSPVIQTLHCSPQYVE
jgi:hypothetical protein